MIGNKFLIILLLSIFCVISINCRPKSVNTFKRSPQSFYKEYVYSPLNLIETNSSVVIAQPTKDGSFYYGICERYNHPTFRGQPCFVMEEVPLTDTASQTQYCNLKPLIPESYVVDIKNNLYTWSDRKVLMTHEMLDSENSIKQLKIRVLKMSECSQKMSTETQVGLSYVKSYQIFTTNEETFDVLWTDYRNGTLCHKYICRNTYDASGKMIRENEIHTRNLITPKGESRSWTTLILGQANQYSYHVERTWAHDNHGVSWEEYTIYRVNKGEMVKVFFKKYFLPHMSLEKQELGLCDLVFDFNNNPTKLPEFNCLRYDLDGNLKLNFTMDMFYFFGYPAQSDLHVFNLENNKIMIMQLGQSNYNLDEQTNSFINPIVFRPDGQHDAPYNINLNQEDFTCSHDSKPQFNVIEKEDEYCFQIICYNFSTDKYDKIKYKIPLVMKCAPKNYYSIE